MIEPCHQSGPLVPRLVTCLRTYDRRTAAADVAAGITVGLVALPLAMAFAIASGLSPQAGLAHSARIRLLEVLSADGEQGVQALQARLDLDQPIVSQQLARLRVSGIVVSRKQGTSVQYALADPRIADLLGVAKAILNRRLTNHRTLLHELRRQS